jgi:hypothetical protein
MNSIVICETDPLLVLVGSAELPMRMSWHRCPVAVVPVNEKDFAPIQQAVMSPSAFGTLAGSRNCRCAHPMSWPDSTVG